jgi:hypothetical protein
MKIAAAFVIVVSASALAEEAKPAAKAPGPEDQKMAKMAAQGDDGKESPCDDRTGWKENTYPIATTIDANGVQQHFFKYLRLWADAAGESHGTEQLMPLDVAFAPGPDPSRPGPMIHRSPPTNTIQHFVNDIPAGFDNVDPPHTTPSRRFFHVLFGVVCFQTSDGDKFQIFPNREVLLEDTTGKGHGTRTVGRKPAIWTWEVLAKGSIVPGTLVPK